MTSRVDVVIVGAGAAGLSAAKSAVSHGLSFVLVEASDRIGGRAHTEDFVPGQPIDRGCHWMHSASLNPFVGIAETLGFRYRRECGWNSTIHHYGAFLDDEQVRGVDALVEADGKAIAAAARHGDPAVADVIDLDSPWAPYHAYWLSLDASCDPDETGAGDIAAYHETDEDWPVIAGHGALVAAWAADVPVTLNAVVQRVIMTRDGVDVETLLGTIAGRTALITVSTNMLVSGRIVFAPGLPSWKTTAAQELPLGVHNKIGILLDNASAAIPESQYLTAMTRNHDVPVALNVRPYGYDYVVGSTAGRFAASLERSGRAASVEFLVEHLKAVFGSRISSCLTDRVITDHLAGRSHGHSAPIPLLGRAKRISGRIWRARSTIACSSPAKPRHLISSTPVTAHI